jgi:2',3'-cyclic-nucleotide 2'-phosphodiesterase (5'-nucleotidase family)
MICKRISAFILFSLMIGTPPALCLSGTDVAGIVPQLLTAVSDQEATSHECTLGDAVADAVRVSLGADIAVVNGGDLVQNLLPGEITWGELKAAFAEDRTLAVAAVTPKELRVLLEACVSRITIDETEAIDKEASAYGGFPQISGFTMSYDAVAPPGERVHDIKYAGAELDLGDDTTSLRLAATGYMLTGGYGLPVVDDVTRSELTLSGAVARYMNAGMPEYARTGVRIYPMGTRDGSLRAILPLGIVAVVIFLIMLGNGQRFKHMFKFEP